ncbi:MAG: RND family efflux transporter, MFP subunit [Parcubacteria group bacterium Gr01-1014_56]|nr:MAG: RND family efflux transporter, MFP subunit [Parcubacteria group bacterium Gr01-1014_56]
MIMNLWRTVRQFFIQLGWLKGSALVIATILVLSVGVSYLKGGATEAAPEDSIKSVTVESVSSLSQGGSSLSVAGIVKSQTEATVRAERSGEVKAVYRALGDSVSAGTIVAEMENASERASVLQAQGALQAATASANVSQGTLASTKDSSVATLLSTYGTVEKVIHTDIDPMFSNPGGNQPFFNVQSADSQAKTNVESARLTLSLILERERARTQSLSSGDDLVAEFIKTESEVKAVRDYLDTVIRTLNAGIASNGVSETTIATYKATATTARSTITTTLSTLITTRLALETALKTSAQGSDTISATQAAITSAQGTLAAARANLEKSIIRAPISGTINSLALERGDFIQATAPVLTVANNHALEVIAYITAQDSPRVSVGGKATFEGDVSGTITRIAPAVDPLTKKIEVRIGLSSGVTTLVNGQSVVVNFEKAAATISKPVKGPITIPIATLKIGSENVVVFTVSAEGTLVAHEVVLGTLLGDRVEIKSGVTPDMQIVTDARGLQPGEKVVVKN